MRHQIGSQLDRFGHVRAFEIARDGNRQTGGNLADHRDGHHVAATDTSVHQLDAARNLAVAADETASLERFEVVVDDAGRRDVELGLDVTDGRGIVVLVEKALDELEDRLLAAGQGLHGRLLLVAAAARGPIAPHQLAPTGRA